MTKAEFFELLSTFTPEEKQALLEEVATYKKFDRYKEQLNACLSDMNSGIARIKSHIENLRSQVDSGKDILVPTFDELTTIFRGA